MAGAADGTDAAFEAVASYVSTLNDGKNGKCGKRGSIVDAMRDKCKADPGATFSTALEVTDDEKKKGRGPFLGRIRIVRPLPSPLHQDIAV